MAQQARERGFTIVELLTVLALGAIVLSLAFPRVSGFLSMLRLDETALALVRDLRFAQAGALARGERYAVHVTSERYSIYRGPILVSEVSLPPDVRVDAVVSSRVIWFSPAGHSSGGFIELRANSGIKTILVSAARGHAYLVPRSTR